MFSGNRSAGPIARARTSSKEQTRSSIYLRPLESGASALEAGRSGILGSNGTQKNRLSPASKDRTNSGKSRVKRVFLRLQSSPAQVGCVSSVLDFMVHLCSDSRAHSKGSSGSWWKEAGLGVGEP